MIKPHGGKLVDRILTEREREKALEDGKERSRIDVNVELARDIENIANGIFSPLEGFLLQEDFLNVLHHKRLSNDLPWTIPIVLDTEKIDANEGDRIAIYNSDNVLIALMDIEEIYSFDKKEFLDSVFGTTDVKHPGVLKVQRMKDNLIGGKIFLVNKMKNLYYHYTLEPVETRILFKEKGWKEIVGFQTRNIPHIGHEYVQKTALTFVDGIFINPIIGKKKKGDFTDELILKTYEALIQNYYLKDRAVMSVLQTEMHYAGPREAVFHAIIRKNFGCTHFIVGRDHAGVGNYYPPYAAQEIFEEFPDLGIIPLFFKSFFYCKKCESVANEKICPHENKYHMDFSGTRIRELIKNGEEIPKELMRPEIVEIIRKERNHFVE